ncbi:hypothetical protein [Antrihabitans spumae]|uniref:Phosphopantetheine adenylyltransferase n=1 Tax=Antrihabitans spumae TaxID=3373370 RepID=A0ABW7KF82_9NOCA
MSIEIVAVTFLVVVGVVNAAPGVVAFSVARTRVAYGVDVDDPVLTVLLRHRAVLLAIVGIGLIVSAFVTSMRVPAIVAAAVSMASYVAIAGSTKGVNQQLRRVLRADIVALVGLGAAGALLAS